MEEITFVFWVDLEYRLRSRKRVPLLGFRGVTVLVPVIHIHVTWFVIHVTWLPCDRAWFSVRSLGRGFGYVRDPLKTQIMSPTNQFQ